MPLSAPRVLPERTRAGPALAASLVFAALAIGCDDGVGVEVPLIQTEQRAYLLTPDAEGFRADIRYTFENRTGGPVYLVNCGGSFDVVLDRRDNGRWVPAWGPVIPGCLSAEIPIGENEVYTDTLHVWGALPGRNTHPQFDSLDPTGTYRIRWGAAYSAVEGALGVGPPIPEEYRVSNSFQLLMP